MERDILGRSYRTTLVLLALAAPFALVYLGPRGALGLVAGGLLGILNLRLVEGLVRNLFRPEGPRRARVALAVALKLTLVYGLACLLLWRGVVTPGCFAAGFPSVLAVILLKAVGRLLVGRDAAPAAPFVPRGGGRERR